MLNFEKFPEAKAGFHENFRTNFHALDGFKRKTITAAVMGISGLISSNVMGMKKENTTDGGQVTVPQA